MPGNFSQGATALRRSSDHRVNLPAAVQYRERRLQPQRP